MSAQKVCPKCGFTNAASALACSNCGTQLGIDIPRILPVTPSPFSPAYSPIPYTFDYAQQERIKRIDRTKNGLLLLIAGVLLAPIPFIYFLGAILSIVGAILVILGREAFGKPHSTYALLSIGVYCAGIISGIALAVVFVIQLIAAAIVSPSPPSVEAVRSAFNGLLIGVIVATAISGIAYILLTYELQAHPGRIILFGAYALSLAIGILIFTIIGPQVSQAFADAVSPGRFNPVPIQELQGQLQVLGLLGLIPNSMYALAYYLARSRINKGEIPQSSPTTTTSGSNVARQASVSPPLSHRNWLRALPSENLRTLSSPH